jgi:phenylpyruvate tautomerase PptA (4-oxalocrotonate tautomerase family)
MPLVKIEVLQGIDPTILFKMRETVLQCVVDTLRLPADDRNIRIIEYAPGYFQMKPPYELLIEITMFKGGTETTKKELIKALVQSLEREIGLKKEKIFIVLNEQPLENWGIQGGIPANEAKLNFRINPIKE